MIFSPFLVHRQLYDLDGKKYDELEVMKIYLEATIEHKLTHPKFMGVKIIYAPIRIIDDERFDHFMKVSQRLAVSILNGFVERY